MWMFELLVNLAPTKCRRVWDVVCVTNRKEEEKQEKLVTVSQQVRLFLLLVVSLLR